MVKLLLFTALLGAGQTTVTPAALQQQLQAEPVRLYLQQLETPAPLPLELLDALRSDSQLEPLARDWLLHKLIVQLRHQRGDAAWQQALQELTNYPDRYFLEQDFEGRSRPLALAPIGQAARGTLQLWQLQQQTAAIQATLNPDAVQVQIATWSRSSKLQQQAWLQAIDTLPADALARLGDIEPVSSAKQAPGLVAAIALRRQDTQLAEAVLSHADPTQASRLLQQLSAAFTISEQLTLLRTARTQPQLRSQSWFAFAALLNSGSDSSATAELQHAARSGDRDAIAAWVQHAGDQLLPEVQQWLRSKREPDQLNAIYALRLLATPAAQQLLQRAAGNAQLSSRAKQELQP